MMRHRILATFAVPVAAGLVLAACSSEPVGGGSGAHPESSTAETDFSSIIPEGDLVAESQRIVDSSLSATDGFTPPSAGPAAQGAGSVIAFVGSDMTNGGINAVSQGVEEAATAIGWTVEVFDGRATAQGRRDALHAAITASPAAIVVGGFDPTEQSVVIDQATEQGIPVVGWHAGPEPGAGNGLVTNITTDPLEVAQLSAAYVVASSHGEAGVAIFTDSQYEIAVLKADAMRAYVEACDGCAVLEYEDSPIAESTQRMPGIISNLLQEHDQEVTHLMAINGNYFGGAQQALRAANLPGDGAPFAVAAGDGDSAEFQRIRNRDYQAATVAEPLFLQGWQIVDEVNRALAGETPSGFIPAPGLVTVANVPVGDVFDPDSGYREIYASLWGVS